ncbi:ScyD/ScyE family protein [Nocardioides bizhenqiangii]|uniref:ScyD/ScyE family protein n=1 Tax=Nocardioides bizhenqiangii TaxID=3095076 RepID=A0ABZ0ZV08_9ACTN|nr:ScyD/ScyE family protein [Nocardioides sp. HM61]WQQ28149.1 ScyD/ScyE family protein [Nocardioides sp. HM61]
MIASGLDNPRGLVFDRKGALYVAEAGSGGDGPCLPGAILESCFGHSGAITRITKWGQRRVVTGLSSFGPYDGAAAIGPSDVAFGQKRMFVTVGLDEDLEDIQALPELADMGELLGVKRNPHGVRIVTVADLAEFEDAFNPTGDEENVNPNSVILDKGGVIVSDAGANDLLLVRTSGKIRVLATFPNRDVEAPPGLGFPPGYMLSMDAVPTSVQRGPDGSLYVGQLTGFPFPPGAANVYRVDRSGEVSVHATGFTNIMDIAFDKRGRLYVLEIFKNGALSGDPTGALVRVNGDGSQTEIMSDGLITPGGLTIRGHHAYVSNCGTCASTGEVLRIPLG